MDEWFIGALVVVGLLCVLKWPRLLGCALFVVLFVIIVITYGIIGIVLMSSLLTLFGSGYKNK